RGFLVGIKVVFINVAEIATAKLPPCIHLEFAYLCEHLEKGVATGCRIMIVNHLGNITGIRNLANCSEHVLPVVIKKVNCHHLSKTLEQVDPWDQVCSSARRRAIFDVVWLDEPKRSRSAVELATLDFLVLIERREHRAQKADRVVKANYERSNITEI